VRSLAQWVDNQQIAAYNRFNDPLLTIISLKNQRHPGPLEADARRLFRLVCYDLDTFRRAIAQNRLPGGIRPSEALQRAAGATDEDLLVAGYRFLEKTLFEEGTSG